MRVTKKTIVIVDVKEHIDEEVVQLLGIRALVGERE
jgi:hypothetical protein